MAKKVVLQHILYMYIYMYTPTLLSCVYKSFFPSALLKDISCQLYIKRTRPTKRAKKLWKSQVYPFPRCHPILTRIFYFLLIKKKFLFNKAKYFLFFLVSIGVTGQLVQREADFNQSVFFISLSHSAFVRRPSRSLQLDFVI